MFGYLKTVSAAAGFAAVMAAGAAGALTLTPTSATMTTADGSSSFQVNLACGTSSSPCNTSSGLTNAVVSANAVFDLLSASTAGTTTTWNFALTLTNTTGTSQPGTNALMSFGWNSTPNVTIASTTTSGLSVVSGSIPSFKLTDICATTTGSCSGGSVGSGLLPGASANVGFTLTTNNSTSLMFDTFAIKFQSVGSGSNPPSAEFGGMVSTVPLPAGGLLLLTAALCGFGLARRRRVS